MRYAHHSMATSLSREEVRHIAKLARISLSEKEEEKFQRELASILEYISKLQEVDTEGVEALEQVTDLKNSFREDTREKKNVSPEALLFCSPLSIEGREIQTPSAHG